MGVKHNAVWGTPTSSSCVNSETTFGFMPLTGEPSVLESDEDEKDDTMNVWLTRTKTTIWSTSNWFHRLLLIIQDIQYSLGMEGFCILRVAHLHQDNYKDARTFNPWRWQDYNGFQVHNRRESVILPRCPSFRCFIQISNIQFITPKL